MTCEHGGHRVPPAYASLFARAEPLASHRGYDIGALDVARVLAKVLAAPLIASETTRLLVDLNRSARHRDLFSQFTRGLTAEHKHALLERHYWPYRHQVESAVATAIDAGRRSIHVSAHSFTPRLGGEVRRADVGLLYDPGRELEKTLCAAWRARLESRLPVLTVRRNYPYRGTADGLVTHLRRRFPADAYVGVELEVNQRWAASADWPLLLDALAATLLDAARSLPETLSCGSR